MTDAEKLRVWAVMLATGSLSEERKTNLRNELLRIADLLAAAPAKPEG